jgi:flavin reductase (DIM6/NTAB) family NADH-FMN oxidoreductase RutF
MNKIFTATDLDKLNENVFSLIDKDWMLITAGVKNSFNTMTASWGGLGILWNRPVAFSFVRPTRHTYGFMEKNDGYTLSFYSQEYRKALELCGSKSGRDIDKVKEAGLTPLTGQTGAIYFEQARLVLECRKIYFQDIEPQKFLDTEIIKNYPLKDYHRMYVGEIVNCLIKSKGNDNH